MIEYIDEIHTYLYDGEIIPSVSEILRFIFPHKYDGIPKSILNAKAGYGSKVHESVEFYELNRKVMLEEEATLVTSVALNLDYIQQASLKQYLKLKSENEIEVIEQEKIIHFKDKYAGRFDMIADIQNVRSLCDIKTTAELDKEYLSWQLSLYAYAYKDLYQVDFEKLYAIWLPKKDLGQLVEIEKKTDNEIKDLLERYRNEYTS